MTAKHPSALSIPLYSLYYYDDPSEFAEISLEYMEKFMDRYSPEEQKEIFHALKWALDNPKYDFHDVLPNLRFSRVEILDYVQRMYAGSVTFMNDRL